MATRDPSQRTPAARAHRLLLVLGWWAGLVVVYLLLVDTNETAEVVAALALAALALLRRRLPGAFRAGVSATGGRVIKGLRHLHNGHIGDYVTWLAVGVSIFGGVCAVTLR